ncbi:MAG: efflux RND transporter periplasmic adaptor subunit [Bacteroidia bacterium]|jgi:RND family efflux transporter MFP subunit|nr:efflux RND transporter periplasmic adaptor subunit [Bacteroidia bacterium]
MRTTLHILIPAAMLVAFTAASCSKGEKTSKLPTAGEAIPVKVMNPIFSSQTGVITAGGQFTTDDETMLSFKTGGIISAVLVKEGDAVRRGQLLATLDVTEISALANQARLGLEKAERDLKRATNLHRDSVATLEQLENARTARDLAQQQLRAAEFNLQHSEIRAVNDGYILRKFANAGQLAGPGTPVFQTNGATSRKWLMRLGVSDREWAQIANGDSATITTDAFPNRTLSAIVSRRAESADPYTGAFIIELTVNVTGDVKPAAGMFGKATIKASAKQDAWEIPYTALLDGNAGEGFIFVTTDGKTAERIPVKIASIAANTVRLSDGPKHGQRIIVSGSAYLTHGSPIRITN